GKHIEMGQGSHTGLATILAEELDADWSQIRVEAAPADAEKYNNLAFGPVQVTGGSTAMANSWEQMRRAGAAARAMLVEAAARDWGVPAAEISVERGVVSHAASGRRATFGELASKAAALTPPAQVTLKDPKDFTLVGKDVRRVDGRAKTDGSAQFAMDFSLPGTTARREGDVDGAMRGAARVLEAVYEFPYLAHAPMEPLDAVIRRAADGVDFWAGSQAPTLDQQAIARILGVPANTVRIHTL